MGVVLTEFLHTTYQAAAELGRWDRDALEDDPGRWGATPARQLALGHSGNAVGVSHFPGCPQVKPARVRLGEGEQRGAPRLTTELAQRATDNAEMHGADYVGVAAGSIK